MNKIRLLVIAFAACAAAHSFADTIRCQGVGWYDLGYKTALDGTNVHYFDKYKDTCGDRLEADALDKYLDGFTQGVIKYCTYDNGYQLGYKGEKPGTACPMEVRAEFQRGYKAGYAVLADRKHQLKRMEEDQEKARSQAISEEEQSHSGGGMPGGH